MALLKGTTGKLLTVAAQLTVAGGTQLTVKWQIAGDLLLLSYLGGECYDSPLFIFSDGYWSLRLFPNEEASNAKKVCRELGSSKRDSFRLRNPNSKRFGLGLFRKDSGPPTTVHFTLGVEGVKGTLDGEGTFSKNDDAFGWSNSRSIFYLYYMFQFGSKLTVTCNLRKDPPRGVEELQKSLQSLLETGKDHDVIIKVQDKEFYVHRLVLQARSPVFEAMFSHEMMERTSGKVTMEDCDPESFSDFLKHVYTGSVKMISHSNVLNLYTAADKYDLNALKVECSEFLKRNLTVECFCDAIALAVGHGDKALVECASKFFCRNSFSIVKTAKWQMFLAENPTVGNELFIKQLSKRRTD